MKKTILLLALLGLSSTRLALADSFNFNTYLVNAQVTDNGVPLSSDYRAQMYWGTSQNQLVSLGTPKSFYETSGYVRAGKQTVPVLGQVYLQLRVWEASGGLTYEDAVMAGKKVGKSDILSFFFSDSLPPSLPKNLAGLRGFELPHDWGDAPSPYPTRLADNGARHNIVPGFCLGQLADEESDGQPDTNATGDDNNPAGANDEDGVTFITALAPGVQTRVDVFVTKALGDPALLNAWVDFDGANGWADAGEQIIANFSLQDGHNYFQFMVPETANLGVTFARFRLSHQGNLSYDGPAPDGEVEDYQVQIIPPLDWGDAPDKYPTMGTLGARHVIVPGGPMLGELVDAELNGQQDPFAMGDDLHPLGPCDEDGVTFLLPLVPGQSSLAQIVAPRGGILNAWMDFGADQSWDEPGNKIVPQWGLNPGTNYLTFMVPATAKIGPTFARFRVSRNGGLTPTGEAPNGEVEDYRVMVHDPSSLDYGDAPSPYPTWVADNGARHLTEMEFCLGTRVDGEADGQVNRSATADDNSPAGTDDEDGVVFSGPLMLGTTVSVEVTLTAAGKNGGVLNAWLDFNGVNGWAEPEEHIFRDVLIKPGVTNLQFEVPGTAKPGTTYARFRLNPTGGLGYNGPALDGEVEDYQVEIQAPYPTSPQGAITAKLFLNLGSGTTVTDLTGNAKFPNNPDRATYPTCFEMYATVDIVIPPPSHVNDQCGGQILGYFYPPTTGDYVFFLAADDEAELYLSTDATPANKKLIAQEIGWSNVRSYTVIGSGSTVEAKCSQTFTGTQWPTTDAVNGGAKIALTQGNVYYIEALFKEGVGGDNLSVAVQDPTLIIDSTMPIPGAYLSSIDKKSGPVKIVSPPQNVTVVEGQQATFSVVVDGTPPYAFKWYKDGVEIPGSAGASYLIPAAAVDYNGAVFWVEVAGAQGSSVISPLAMLTVVADTTPPAISQVTASDTFMAITVTFSEPVLAQDAAVIGHYTIGGLTVTGVTIRTLTEVELATSRQAPDTEYTLTVANIHDAAYNKNLIWPPGNTLKFRSYSSPGAPRITQQPQAQIVAIGSPANFEVIATGPAPLQYQWTKNGPDLQNQTTPILAIAAAQATDSGTYRVRVSNAFGTTTSDPAELVVVELGDLNNSDGKLSIEDAIISIELALKLYLPSPHQEIVGDINGDAKLDIQDSCLILLKIVEPAPQSASLAAAASLPAAVQASLESTGLIQGAVGPVPPRGVSYDVVCKSQSSTPDSPALQVREIFRETQGADQIVELSVEFVAGTPNPEAAVPMGLTFTLSWDPALLSYQGAEVGIIPIPLPRPLLNTNQVAQGRLALGAVTADGLTDSTLELVRLRFVIKPEATSDPVTPLRFTDEIAPRKIAGFNEKEGKLELVPATSKEGQVVINPSRLFSLTLTANPPNYGSVSAYPSGLLNNLYLPGTAVTITFLAYPPYIFKHWGGAAAGTQNPITVTMDTNKWVEAHFDLPPQGQPTIWWIAASGNWTNPANWNNHQLPGPEDVVLIDRPDTNITVTFSGGNASVISLRSEEALVLSGGRLAVANTIQVNNGFTLSGGTMRSGILLPGTNGAGLKCAGGTLDQVMVEGDLDLTTTGASVNMTNGLVLNGAARLGYGSLMNFYGTQTLSGRGAVAFNPSYSFGLRLMTRDMALTIGPDFTIRGGAVNHSLPAGIGMTTLYGSASNISLINLGTILADVPNGLLVVDGGHFENQGTLKAVNGGYLRLANMAQNRGTVQALDATLELGGQWNNDGSIMVSNSTLNLAGSFKLASLGTIRRTGGFVRLTGLFDNRDTTLALNAASGSWQLAGGTISGGTVTGVEGAQLIGVTKWSKLDGATVNIDLDLSQREPGIIATNGLVFNGTARLGYGSLIDFYGTQTLSGQGAVVFNPTASYAMRLMSADMTLTIGPQVTIRGGAVNHSLPAGVGMTTLYGSASNVSLINYGAIRADVSNGLMVVDGGSFTNHGVLEAANGGILRLTRATLKGGSAQVAGRSVIDAIGALQFDGQTWLGTQPGGAVKLGANLLGNTRNKSEYLPWGTTWFNGSGKPATPQLLEVMSLNLDTNSAGFISNFVYSILILTNRTRVQLVDQWKNNDAPGAEALYVHTLVLAAGTTLDLNGFRVYCRELQMGGQVLNGTVTRVEDTGPATPPRVHVELQPGRLVFTWPASVSGAVLEMTESLTPPIRWQELDLTPATEQDQKTVAIQVGGGLRFYRLKAQGP